MGVARNINACLYRLFYLYGVSVMTEKRRFNYRHVLCVAITLGFVACGVFLYQGALGRIIEGCRDLGLSIAYYFCELFDFKHGIQITVNELPKVPFFENVVTPDLSTPLPDTWSGFQSSWTRYWEIWATEECVNGYLSFLADILFQFCQIVVMVLPFVVAIYLYLVHYLRARNNDYDEDSSSVAAFKRIKLQFYTPVKNWCVTFYDFIKERKGYWVTWLCLWLFYFNVFTIGLEFFAYYFYFVISFDVKNIYRQVYKLFLDLSVPFKAIPLFAWVILAIVVFDRTCKKIAYARLNHYEYRDRGFINARPIVYMVCGTMGKKKTTAISDMALSQEVMFRDKAFEKLLENDLKFPYFPWINLELEIKAAMEKHEIYNLATVRRFIAKRRKLWQREPTNETLFGYDYERYGLEYDDKLRLVNVWEVVDNYAQLYFIYVIQSSLLISNYSVRVDNVLEDLGNFPLWNSDFFRRDSRLMESYSRHAHILDFDSLRLGQRVVENNRNANNFEFGVVLITEVGKERGNSLELSEKKKKDETANQKNDLFNSWLKMVRHSATVDNFPFVRVITDEQRPESWGADARDLCEIVNIVDSGEMRLALPFFTLAELLYEWIFGKFTNLYYQYRFVRSDNTLPMYLLKGLVAKIQHYYKGVYNRFGYCKLQVQVESGRQDGATEKGTYYLMSKKIYSKRFSTDCFSDFFTEKALRSPVGIDDLAEYDTEKATFDELGAQNSYFVGDLLNGLRK